LHIGHRFWGAGNIGDDWMLAGFLCAVKLRGQKFRVTCCVHHNSLDSMRLRFPQVEWFGMDVDVREALISDADVWLGLGSTPFQSDAGTAILDHIVEDLELCQRCGTPVYFLGVGAEGPEACRLPQTSWVLDQARHLWVRDRLSATLLGDVAGGRTRITQAADLAHIYFDSLPATEDNRPFGNVGLVINVERAEQLDFAELSKFILLHNSSQIRWIAQEVRSLQVSEVCLWEKFTPGLRERLIPAIPDYQGGTLESFLPLYAGLTALLSTRYHSTLAAAWRGVAVSVYARSRKMDGLVSQLGCATCESLTNAEKITEGLANAKPIMSSLLREAARTAQTACDEFFQEIAEIRSVHSKRQILGSSDNRKSKPKTHMATDETQIRWWHRASLLSRWRTLTGDPTQIRWWHRIRMPDGSYTPGEVIHGPDGGDWPTTRFAMPENLSGKTVIDVGAWDGFFSFEAEGRGAKLVVAVDCERSEGGNWGGTKGFNFARKQLKSKVQFRHLNIEKPGSVDGFATFDLVLCYGVLYHLKSPLLAIENLSKLTKVSGQCLLETAISKSTNIPSLEYHPGWQDDPTNYFYPNLEWVTLAARENGFKNIKLFHNSGHGRAVFILEK
jgi:tRNA (mo5U34)-methyltransferase